MQARRSETEAARARTAANEAAAALVKAATDHAAAERTQAEATTAAEAAEILLVKADESRMEVQARETEARAVLSEAEGEFAALKAEAMALMKLVEREASAGRQLLDRVEVRKGYEKALGAALADDLRAPEVEADAASGWAVLPRYGDEQALPEGVKPLSAHVTVPPVLARRIGQIGFVDRRDGARLQPLLKPGQRLVSEEGDLWRWDGFRAGAEDAPTAAALRLQQLNRLTDLKRDLEEAKARAEGARQPALPCRGTRRRLWPRGRNCARQRRP